jgi:hypothetical protein
MLDNPEQNDATTWARITLDFPMSALHQQLSYTGAVMKNETPNYMKRSALAGVAMLLPFPIVIAINSLSDHTLLDSHVWKPFYLLLLVALPAVAFLLNSLTFWRWSAERRKTGTGLFRNLFDVRHNWSVVIVAMLGLLFALFIPFHDSVHCVTGNPIRELHNPHQTWQCIQQR